MDINTVIIIIEKMQQNLRYFNLKFCLNSITPCDITKYCIAGLKTIYSNSMECLYAVFDAVLRRTNSII